MRLAFFSFALTLSIALATQNIFYENAAKAKNETDCACCDPPTKPSKGFNLNAYHTYAENMAYIDSLPGKYKNLVTIRNVSQTYEKRRIVLVKISSDPAAKRNIIFINGGTHAREWVSPVSCLAMMNHVLNAPSLLKKFDWYFMPMMNPDGYEYSRKVDRNWRKNRSKHGKSKCVGVDINRNYGFHWGEAGASKDPCDKELYKGPKPFSEQESRALKNVLTKLKKRIVLFSSMHTYGEAFLIPYGYDKKVFPDNWKDQKQLAREMADAVCKVADHKYVVLNAGRLYEASGGAEDFAAGALKIKYSIIFEITSGYEFEYPEKLLKVSNNETITAFTAAAKFLIKNGS